jgi:hypothetical protein
MTQGSCLCGAVRFEFDGAYKWFLHCHCGMCRKHHGALHGSIIAVDPSQFRLLQGDDAIVHYRSSKAFERPFCRHCGSKVPDVSGAAVGIPPGTINDALSGSPPVHIFVAHKSPMETITDGLKQFDEYPPGHGFAASVPENVEASATGGRGSCLCGAVAYEISGAQEKIVQCHCSRCRRSRGTSHAANTFVPKEQLRFTRGADAIKTFRPPDASRFATAFCEHCGSAAPVLFDGLNRYLVPVGSLDTPFKIRSITNIYVGSKAQWYTMTGDFAAFDELPPREKISELLLG